MSTALKSAGSMKDSLFFLFIFFFFHFFFLHLFFSFLFILFCVQQEPVGKRNVYWYSKDYKCLFSYEYSYSKYLEGNGNFGYRIRGIRSAEVGFFPSHEPGIWCERQNFGRWDFFLIFEFPLLLLMRMFPFFLPFFSFDGVRIDY